MDKEELFKKAEELLYSYNDLKDNVLNDSIDTIERRKAAIKVKKIHNALSVLDDIERDLAIKRYFKDMSWYKILKSIGYKSSNSKAIQNKCIGSIDSIVSVLFPGEYYCS